MDRFSKLNPKAVLLFFLLVIVQSLVFFNPVFLFVNLVFSLFYNIKLQGTKAIKGFCTFTLPMMVIIGLFNMMFAHYGSTVLFELFNNPFTFESFFYGFTQGMMLSSVLMWISCYSIVLSTDKFLSVFSGIAPSISLTLSMVLSFIPRMRKNAQEIGDAQSTLYTDKSKLSKAFKSLSALVSLTLEESIELSDSMRARGFSKNRKAYSKYKFRLKDGVCIAFVGITFILSMLSKRLVLPFAFEPKISFSHIPITAILFYSLLCAAPLIIDFTEDMRWLYLKSKI